MNKLIILHTNHSNGEELRVGPAYSDEAIQLAYRDLVSDVLSERVDGAFYEPTGMLTWVSENYTRSKTEQVSTTYNIYNIEMFDGGLSIFDEDRENEYYISIIDIDKKRDGQLECIYS